MVRGVRGGKGSRVTAVGGFKIGDAPDLDQSGITPGHVIVVAPDGVTYELSAAAGGVTDHGDLTGLADDDHPQYHTDARGDLRYQPLDSDLTAIAALTTTAFGRALLELANQSALLSAAGAAAASHAHAGEDITSGTVADARIASTIARDSEVTSAIAALSTVYQPLDSDLTSIAALTTTAFGRGLLELADQAALLAAAGAAAASHAHAGEDITSGTIADARIASTIARDSEVTAAVDAHANDATDAHDASAISVLDTGGNYTATDVEGVLAEIAPQLGGGSGESLVREVSQTGHGLDVGDVVRLDGTDYVAAQADSAANAEVVGIVSAVAGVDDFTLHYGGRITGLSGLTAGEVYFLSATTAGLLTATAPSGDGEVSKPVLVADSTTTGYFCNYRGMVLPAGAGGAGPLDWQDVNALGDFINGAANFGGGYGDAMYAKDADFLHLSGAVNPGTDGEIIQLPVGYRPSVGRIATAFADGGVQGCEIRADGVVDFFSNPGASAFLDGIKVKL